MTRPLQLLTLLSLTTALLSAAPAQAGFEFVSKATPKPAATVAAPAPALVPVTNTTPSAPVTPMAVTPVWTAKAPSPTIPLTPVVSASDSLQVIDAPLIPDMDDEIVAAPVIAPAPAPVAVVPAPLRQTLASQSSENVSSAPAAPVSNEKRNSVLWDKPLAETEKPMPLSAMTTSRNGNSITTSSGAPKPVKAAPLPLPEEIVDTKAFDPVKPVITTTSPEPIVETILETPQAPVAMAPNDDAIVQGFGSGLPMVLALRQIVPPHYRFSFGPNVDPGQRVNWQGGKKWSEIVADLAQKNGLQSEIAGNVVAIRRSGTVNNTASIASNNMMEDVVMGDSPLAAPVLPAPIVTPTRTTLSSSNTVSKPLPIISTAKAPAEKAPISLLATPDDIESEKMPVVNKAIDVSPVQKDVVKTEKALPKPAKSELLPPITEETTILADPLPTPAEIKKDDAKKVDVNVDLTAKQEWVAANGKTLRTVLQDWSKEANVSLVWSSDFDYPLQTDIRIQGTYAEAVRTLLAGFGKAQPKPTGRLHKNAGVGAQPVLIIDTPRLINNG